MFVRLFQFHLKPDKIDEAVKSFRESILPRVNEEKGLISYSVCLDRNTGKGATIIYFNTEENMLANESSGQPQKMRDEFKDYWAAPYIVDRCEVCAQIQIARRSYA